MEQSNRANNPSNPQQTGYTAISTNRVDDKGRDVKLAVNSDAAYLVLPGAKSRFAGHFYL
eukprot:6597903-Ditylum_brightwellii.AAC.1